MRKFLLLFVAAFCSFPLMSQTVYQKLSLKEAVEKSKETNRLVMAIASATW